MEDVELVKSEHMEKAEVAVGRTLWLESVSEVKHNFLQVQSGADLSPAVQ